MQEIDIISKGEYAFLQSDPLLQTESYVIFVEQGKKYLLLKWHNLRKETLTGLDFTVGFYDARGAKLGERRIPAGKLQKAGQTSFVLDIKIEIPADCADFRVQINRARYGKYAYVPRGGGVALEYDVSPRRTPCVPIAEKGRKENAEEDIKIRVRRPVFPIWVSFVTFLIFACVMVFMAWQAAAFGEDKNSFLRNGVRYSFVDGNQNEGSAIVVSGFWGRPVNVKIEAEIDGHPVTSVNRHAFSDCYSLKSISFKGLISIKNNAFDSCVNLQSVNFENVTKIEEEAFRFCYDLKEVASDRLVYIGDYAFNGCRSLEEVELSAIEFLGRRCFNECYRLATIQLDNADAPLEISQDVFAYCSKLKTVIVDQEITLFDDFSALFFQCVIQDLKIRSLDGEKTFDEQFPNCRISGELEVGSMPQVPQSFCSGMNLSKLTIGHLDDPVIGNNAFSGCSNLEEVRLPEGLTSIGDNAFYDCDMLTEITLPASLQQVGFEIFQECDKLYEIFNNSSLDLSDSGAKNVLKIYENGEGSVPKEIISDFTFGYFGTQWVMIDYPRGSETLALPDLSDLKNGIQSYTIANSLFYRDEVLTRITIPSAVSALGKNSFSDCYVLENVEFTGSVLTVLPEYVFSNCSALTEITIPQGITEIREGAFYQSGLQTVVLPKTLRLIGEFAFAGCTLLRTVYNLSTLTLTKGSNGYGGVAQYAENIYTSTEQ